MKPKWGMMEERKNANNLAGQHANANATTRKHRKSSCRPTYWHKHGRHGRCADVFWLPSCARPPHKLASAGLSCSCGRMCTASLLPAWRSFRGTSTTSAMSSTTRYQTSPLHSPTDGAIWLPSQLPSWYGSKQRPVERLPSWSDCPWLCGSVPGVQAI